MNERRDNGGMDKRKQMGEKRMDAVCWCVCLSVCMSVCPSVNLSVSQSICLFISVTQYTNAVRSRAARSPDTFIDNNLELSILLFLVYQPY